MGLNFIKRMYRKQFDLKGFTPYIILYLLLYFLDGISAYYNFFNPVIHPLFLNSERNGEFINALLSGNILYYEFIDLLRNFLILFLIYFIYEHGIVSRDTWMLVEHLKYTPLFSLKPFHTIEKPFLFNSNCWHLKRAS